MKIQNINLEEKDSARLVKLASKKGIPPTIAARLLILQGMDRIEKNNGKWEL